MMKSIVQKNKKSSANDPKNNRNLFIIFLVLCFCAGFACHQYYNKLSSTVRDESKDYLLEISHQISNNISQNIEYNHSGLRTLAESLSYLGIDNFQEVDLYLSEQKENWNYQKILLVDDQTKMFDLNDDEVFVEIDEALRGNILEQRESMSVAQVINNKEYVLFSVPLNTTMNGKNIIALIGIYDPSTFEHILSMTAFEERAASLIITKNGTIVTRSTQKSPISVGYNAIASIENSSTDSKEKFEKLKIDIENNREDQINFSSKGKEYYMAYTSIDRESWYLLTLVPVEVVNAKSDMLLYFTLIISGVVVLLFAGLITYLVYSFSKNRRNLEEIAYVDDLTGGKTIAKFYRDMHSTELINDKNTYALLYTNIEKFKLLNDQLGREECDNILKTFHDFMVSTLNEHEFMGHEAADNFCVLVDYKGKEQLIDRIIQWQKGIRKYILQNNYKWNLPIIQFGIYVIVDNDLTYMQYIDRAKTALRETSNIAEDRFQYAFYDDNIREKLYREKKLEDNMERALSSGEFKIYLQPKYALPDEKIEGAEALIRWESPTEGMIFPNEFIPIFERNKFIIKIDLFVCEEVCKIIKKWKDAGLPQNKISINCSRAHFQYPNFIDKYIRIVDSYGIDRKDIEIELTESIVFENTDVFLRVIESIKEAGFSCSMDDFGSGYSSLNMIQNIPVDTLKIDRIFFHSMTANYGRTKAVIRNIIQLANELDMTTVAEGVESREHVEMLKQIGCNYIQGYVFAKPMTVEDFETLAFKGDIRYEKT